MRNHFTIHRNELKYTLVWLVFICALQYLMLQKFWGLFANYGEQTFNVFMRNYHMSGFDPITLSVLTDWNSGYDVLRHPLLALFMLPLSLVNKGVWAVTGMNCAMIISSITLTICAFYSLLFLYRTMKECIGVGEKTAFLLSLLFFSFGYVMVATVVADHFCLSMLCLCLAIYLSAQHIKVGTAFSNREIFWLTVVTAGITSSNVVPLMGMIAVVNGRRLFAKNTIATLCAAAFLLATPVVWHIATTPYEDAKSAVESQTKWVRQDISRLDVMQENFFGEGLQLHRKHVLGDVLNGRPVIVRYNYPVQNAVTIIIEALLIVGLWCGRREKLTLILCGVLAFNMLLHIGLAFAIDELYIMTAHWAMVLPLGMAYIFKTENRYMKVGVYILISIITIYLLMYHGYLLHRYLTWPLVK